MLRLRELRRSRKLTQREVAEKLEMDKSNYSKIENRKRNLDFQKCRKLALVFDVSMDYLCNLTDNPVPHERTGECSDSYKRIRELRKAKNRTQLSVQVRINISQSNISKLENGHAAMSISQCMSLAKELGTSMDYLAGLTDVKERYV